MVVYWAPGPTVMRVIVPEAVAGTAIHARTKADKTNRNPTSRIGASSFNMDCFHQSDIAGAQAYPSVSTPPLCEPSSYAVVGVPLRHQSGRFGSRYPQARHFHRTIT